MNKSVGVKYFFDKINKLLLFLEAKHVSGLSEQNALVGSFHAAGNLFPDRSEKNVHEEVVGGRRNVAFGEKHFVVAALHQVLLQWDRMTDVNVWLNDFWVQELQLGVELGQTVSGKQAQQVQANQLIFVWWLGDQVSVNKLLKSSWFEMNAFMKQRKWLKLLEVEVKSFELAHIALERWDITDGNGALGTNLKHVT